MQKYDYIISGTGASGLMLAYHMVLDPFFDNKQILLIDKEAKNRNDRTWCFWERFNDSDNYKNWDDVVSKKWDTIFFGSKTFSDHISILPYQYKLIRSKDFYEFVLHILINKANITIVKENVLVLKDEGTIVELETDKALYLGDKVFNSVPLSSDYKNQQRYPVLNQHFIGWFIKTKNPSFDTEMATFMDFAVAQNENTRFMYMLPFSETEALFEYTLFSEKVLSNQEYEDEIIKYLEEKGISGYEITKKEQGSIPMTSYEFRKQNSKNILHIGTAGGWTKPSTGYTFHNSSKKVKKLVQFLKMKSDLTKFEKRTKFWYYDLLFLDLLHKENQNGAELFSRLFQKNKTTTILKFLDEETTFVEDLKIMRSMPVGKFLRIIWNRVVK